MGGAPVCVLSPESSVADQEAGLRPQGSTRGQKQKREYWCPQFGLNLVPCPFHRRQMQPLEPKNPGRPQPPVQPSGLQPGPSKATTLLRAAARPRHSGGTGVQPGDLGDVGSWKGTGTPSWTEEPCGRAILALSESSTLSSMPLRTLLLRFSSTMATVTWLSSCKLPRTSQVCGHSLRQQGRWAPRREQAQAPASQQPWKHSAGPPSLSRSASRGCSVTHGRDPPLAQASGHVLHLT
ncbi:hypothetical protein P7K49_032836 [Saguinus oedipus]|uniref:Uncharacterized protein n=1 Tax=Saguinus oedipus TaxID=9490 RepID=A0ABQ9TQ71_SAGOE|nr:hypothetical protein P7K49_032836 [Saguinus oedipus]